MHNSREIENLCKIIDTFNVDEHIHILQIIKDNETLYNISENNNGIFINMEDLNKDTIKKIQEHVNYVLLKEGHIKEIEDTKDKLKNDINNFTILNHVEI
jgi:hypothetical protein